MNAPPLVYVAGPYRAPTTWEVEQNIRAVESLGAEVAKLGAYPVMPHANTRGYFESFQPGAFWLAGTIALLQRCDATIFTHDWPRSEGTREEHAWCVENKRPHFDQPGVGALMALAHWIKQSWSPVLAEDLKLIEAGLREPMQPAGVAPPMALGRSVLDERCVVVGHEWASGTCRVCGIVS